ncbi:DUF3772 domain-containing protein [Paracoccus aminophilus]|uniref:MscS mechanosensitive ion channel n=1 Tax=Paracoccus aminophilus JCM 7686 TaxID=1367847 RepID=S5XSP2_PARAH|nr:DUF3772 domain-containing protein [Paracoccus aminophilus]AGT08137.1 MscS mechanosensitive ion channel [Paracoccus aminophilus JCM 7686]
MRRLAAFAVAVFFTLTSLVAAQDTPQPDYTAWEKLASQAEQILQSGQANDARLEAIRAEVVKWRDQFRAAEGTNATRISTLKDQINALGPPPAEGQTESDDLATRRKSLNSQLSELQAPGLTAVEAFGRADGVVQQIDKTQRERQATALQRLAPTPLNPKNWAPALQEGYQVVAGISNEVMTRFQTQGGWQGARDWAPSVAIILLIAVLLLSKGRRWIDSLPSRLSARASERTRAALDFAVSLGQILVPLIGVILLVAALIVTNLFDQWGLPILFALPGAGLALFGAIWISRRLFPAQPGALPISLPLPEKPRAQARINGSFLGVALALHQVFGSAILPLSSFSGKTSADERIPLQITDASAAVWHLPIICLGAYFLFRFSSVLRHLPRYDSSENPPYRLRIGAIIGSAGRLVALVAPVLAAIGFVAGANALLWPMIMTMALIGLLILLQDFIADLYAMAKGGDKSARDGLVPVLVGFALVLASAPLFVLIWGARTAELSEFWSKMKQGVAFGGVRISPTGIFAFVAIFLIGYSITRAIQGAFRSTILPKTKIDAGGQNAIVSGLGYVGVILALMLAVTSAGVDLTSLALFASALSVGIGFGLQNIVSNFVSGIILLIERPITVGDWIEVGGKQGIVKRISVRSTHIQTFDRTEVIVPNSDFVSQSVTNWTRNNLSGRIIVPVGVAYGTDTRKVARVLAEIAEDQPTVLITPPPSVVFKGFGTDAMNFEIRAIVSDINGGTGVVSEINHQIAARFAQEGIELPFPQRDIWLRNPEALGTAPELEAKAAPESGDAQEVRDEAPQAPDATPAGTDHDDGAAGENAGYGERFERD